MRPMILTCALLMAANAAHAACYADYKAKRDNPLKLHYGVAQITGTCKTSDAKTD